MKSKPIKLTTTSYALLALLDQLGEATSYDIKQALEKSIENFWPVPHTTAYEEPARLAAGGYLLAQQEAGGRRRKLYSLTDAGRAALRGWAAEPSAAPPQLRDETDAEGLRRRRSRAATRRPDRLAPREAGGARGLSNRSARGRGLDRRSERALIAGIAYHRKMLEMMAAPLESG